MIMLSLMKRIPSETEQFAKFCVCYIKIRRRKQPHLKINLVIQDNDRKFPYLGIITSVVERITILETGEILRDI